MGGKVVAACSFRIIYQIEIQFGTLIKNHKSIRLICFNWLVDVTNLKIACFVNILFSLHEYFATSNFY